jgi:hypothetical protein
MCDKRQKRTRKYNDYTDHEVPRISEDFLAKLLEPYNNHNLVADTMQAFALELLPARDKKTYKSPRRMLLRLHDHQDKEVKVRDVHGDFRPVLKPEARIKRLVEEALTKTTMQTERTPAVGQANLRPRRNVKLVNYKGN